MSDNHPELNALKEQIEAFIKAKNPEIFALTGKWGVGKTFALKNVIDDLNKSDDTKKILDNYTYVSLFGLKDIKDIESKIVVSLTKEEINDLSQKQTSKKQSICESIEYYFKKSLKWVKNFTIYIKDSLKYFSDTHFNKIRFFTGLAELIFINRMIKNKIICFDDFERTSIDTQELLGFLQDLKEERNCNIILIYNEEKLENERKNDFDTYREKVIDKHFDYTPLPSETVILAFRGAKNENPFTNIESYQAFIAEKCEALKLNNIRIIQKILNHINKDIHESLEKVTWSRDIYPDIKKDVTEHIISAIILYAFLYFQGDYKKKDLEISKDDFEQNFNIAQFEKHYAKIDVPSPCDDQFDKGFEEKQEKERIAFEDFHAKRVLIQSFIGADFDFDFSNECQSEIQAISNHIIQLIKAGYLLEDQKKDFKEQLEKFNHFKANNIDRNKKNQIWDSITDERRNKFINDDYPQRFYQSAKDIVTFESIKSIDFMVRFLKDHNMPTEAQEIIYLWLKNDENIQKCFSGASRLLKSDIEKMDSDVKKAYQEKIKELRDIELNKISLEEALKEICFNDDFLRGYPQEKVKRATQEEIKSFFLLENLSGFSRMGSELIRQNVQNAIPALYEIYQDANEPRKRQIRADEIFGDALREVYPKEFIDEHIKSMIDEILGTPTAPIGAS